MRRIASFVASACTGLLVAACGGGSSLPGAHARTSASYRTDPTGRVACSTRSLPFRYAGAVRFDATLDGVTARFVAVAERKSFDQWLVHPQLTLTSRGRQWRTTPKPAPHAFQQHYRPVETPGPGHVSGFLCLVDFSGEHEPPAVLTTYSGGAHCCTTVRLYDLQSRAVRQLDLGNMGARIIIADGTPVIETRDDAFSYAFTDFADSGAPVRLFAPGRAGFRDVTREFPALIRADATSQWSLASRRTLKLGFYAAWSADEEMLGHDAHVWRTMRRLERAGRLMVPPNLREPGWPDGQAYLTKLRQFLTARGYRRNAG